MSDERSSRREARRRDSRRAGLFLVLATATGSLSDGLDDGGLLLSLGVAFVLVSIYYVTRSTFRLESEDDSG